MPTTFPGKRTYSDGNAPWLEAANLNIDQEFLEDLAQEKVEKTGDTMSGQLQVGTGDVLGQFNSPYAAGQLIDVRQGTNASPSVNDGAIIKASRTSGHTRAQLDTLTGNPSGDGSDEMATITAATAGTTGCQVQIVGLHASAKNAGTTAGANGKPDSCGLYSTARVTGTGIGLAIGAAIYAAADSANSKCNALELGLWNASGANGAINTTGFGGHTGIWLHAGGASHAASGIQIGNPFGAQFATGIHFNAQASSNATVGSTTGPTIDQDIRTDSLATTTLLVNGTHTYGIDFNGGTFSGGMVRLKNDVHVVGRNAAGSADVNLYKFNSSNQMQFAAPTNFQGAIQYGQGINIVLDSTTGTKLGTAATQKLGFWNATPVVRPTGWGAPTGTATRTTFATTTATVTQLAERLKGLIDDLTTIGVIGA